MCAHAGMPHKEEMALWNANYALTALFTVEVGGGLGWAGRGGWLAASKR